MGTRLVSGIVAGLAGSVVFAVLATVMADVVAGAGLVTLMGLIGNGIGSRSLPLTWVVVLGTGALLGGIFGVLAGRAPRNSGRIASYGLFYGLGLGLGVGVVAVPLLLGSSPSSRAIWAWIPATLMACLLFASVLAVLFVWLQGGRAMARETQQALRRAA